MTTFKHAAAAALAMGALLIGSSTVRAQAKPNLPDPTLALKEGRSEPSQRSKLAAQVPGIVKEILVKRGDEVKAGQPVIQQDDRLAVNQLEILEKEANSTIRVDAAKADLDQKQVELKRLRGIYSDPSAPANSNIELERAELEVVFKGHQL